MTSASHVLVVKARPGSRKLTPPRRVMLPDGTDAVELAVQAPAVEGQANEAIRARLADLLGVPRRTLTLTHGAGSRIKRFRLEGDAGVLEQARAWFRALEA